MYLDGAATLDEIEIVDVIVVLHEALDEDVAMVLDVDEDFDVADVDEDFDVAVALDGTVGIAHPPANCLDNC